jgi:choline dehydrogenase-like flavoprotein
VIDREYDVVIIGSGAGGGTVALGLAPLAEQGRRVLLIEQGPRLADEEFTGEEIEMAEALYADSGGFLTADGTMTLAFGRVYGGSTAVYTGTSLIPEPRVRVRTTCTCWSRSRSTRTTRCSRRAASRQVSRHGSFRST